MPLTTMRPTARARTPCDDETKVRPGGLRNAGKRGGTERLASCRAMASGSTMQLPQLLPNRRDHARAAPPELLAQELASGRTVMILDVRGSEEFRGPKGRLPGARSMPLHQIPARWSELASHRSESIVVVSNRGLRARLAAVELELAGFTEVRYLEGGLHRWRELGLALDVPPQAG